MSKPVKYQSFAEKSIGVPGTSNNNSDFKPYTIPYTGAGAQRNENGDWLPHRTIEVPSVPSHAAPPIYMTDSSRNAQASSTKEGEKPAYTKDAKDDGHKRTASINEGDVSRPSFPASYLEHFKSGSEDRQ
ncbi:hypothetical protein F4804DRAFT_331054 [Jackrogersella minutella]|nr:hypothetical protein F4804DRAFT_331054 [Jackrogersella minutella]